MEPREGKPPKVFLLTAGHCAAVPDNEVWRAEYDGDAYPDPYSDAGKHVIGNVARITLNLDERAGVRTDATAIRIKDAGVVPVGVLAWGEQVPTKPAGWARKGTILCYSGSKSKTAACGKVVARSANYHPEDAPFGLGGYWVRFPEDKRPDHGDSGGPVWNKLTGRAVGLISASRPEEERTETLVAPLLHPPNMNPNYVPGILKHQGIRPMQLKLGE